MIDNAEKRKKAVRLLIILTVFALCIGTIWIILYSWQATDLPKQLTIIGVAAILAGGFFVVGLLIGFIFGVARPKGEGVTHVSTNLEDISEWLTKIVVGAGLAQLATLPSSLGSFGDYVVKKLLGTPDSGAILAIGILIYYLTCGLLSGFLLTRLYFLGLLEKG
jgi:uncharacterized membrane protein (DUF485 family)